MVDVLVAAGSNLGNRRQVLDEGVALLAKRAGVHVVAVSRWIETPPIGGTPGQQPFLNGAIRIETELAPESLLDTLQQVEHALGRERGERWGPRTIDLDLLLYGDQKLRTQRLVVPHPRMSFRRFVLAPAREIAADMIHPEIGWSIEQIIEHLDQAANYVAITGPPGAGQSALVSATCAAIQAQCLIAEPSWRELMGEPRDAGDRAAAALGWIDHNIRRLQQFDWQSVSSPQPPVISDYWLEASPAEARIWLTPTEAEYIETNWPQRAAQCVRPKLIVLLDASALCLSTKLRQSKEASDIDRRQLNQCSIALRRVANQGGHGPVLRLDARYPDRMLSETCAAIAAMCPCEAA